MKFKVGLILILGLLANNYSAEQYPEQVDWRQSFALLYLSVDELLIRLEAAVLEDDFSKVELILNALNLGHKVFQDTGISTLPLGRIPEFVQIYRALERIRDLSQNPDIRELIDIEMAIFEVRNTPQRYTNYGRIGALSAGSSREGMHYIALFELEEALKARDIKRIEETAIGLDYLSKRAGVVIGRVLQGRINRALSQYQQYKSEAGAGGAAGPA
ncbi:hypothetical protein A3F66_00415 [candidate division TM6 bacterium RIFCSPHIGHO2_12_FULL_32_22]|nr:MAG: hypothetical protein A3F66_00415 [candidate division TM6 bacterium RIFCSPHIGHO2_12_FULL_32_22]